MASELAGLILSGGIMALAAGMTPNGKKRPREEIERDSERETVSPSLSHKQTHTLANDAQRLFDAEYALAWSSGALQRGDTLSLATPFTNPFASLQVALSRRLAVNTQFVLTPTPALALDLSFLLRNNGERTQESEEELFLALSRKGLLLLPSAAWNTSKNTQNNIFNTVNTSAKGGFSARFGHFFVTIPLSSEAQIDLLLSRLQELITERSTAVTTNTGEVLPEKKEEERENGEEPRSKRAKTVAPDTGNIDAVAMPCAHTVVSESAVSVSVSATEGLTETETTSPSPEHAHTLSHAEIVSTAVAAEAESDAESVFSTVSTVSLSTGVRRKVRRAKDAIASEKTKKKREKVAKTAAAIGSIPEGDEEQERERETATEREFHTPRRVRATNPRVIDLS